MAYPNEKIPCPNCGHSVPITSCKNHNIHQPTDFHIDKNFVFNNDVFIKQQTTIQKNFYDAYAKIMLNDLQAQVDKEFLRTAYDAIVK